MWQFTIHTLGSQPPPSPISHIPATPHEAARALIAEIANLDKSVEGYKRRIEILNAIKKLFGCADARHLALIADCKITVLGEGRVSLTLPDGMSRATFLEAAQPLARELYGRDPIYPVRLKSWMSDRNFAASHFRQVAFAIDGNVKGSSGKTRDEQVLFLSKLGLQMAELRDVAVAHAAYFLATGKDLFSGDLVRAHGGTLGFYPDGLDTALYEAGGRLDRVAASACLSAGM